MFGPMRKLIPLFLALLLVACGDETRTAGGVSKGEAAALDDAAEMVEQQRPPVEAAAAGAAPAATATETAKPGG